MKIQRQGVYKDVSEQKYQQVFKPRGYEPVLKEQEAKKASAKPADKKDSDKKEA